MRSIDLNRLCIFGDSITKGVVLDQTKRHYSLLKENFVSLFSKKNGITIKNYSLFGCTIEKGTRVLGKHFDDLRSYDYVVLEFGGNDCNFDWSLISEEPDKEHTPVTTLSDFSEMYRNLIQDIQSHGGHPLLLNLPPLDSEKFLTWISKDLSRGHILQWLGDVDHIYRWHEEYNNEISKIARDLNIPLIDIRSIFNRVDFSDYLCEDGMHPNEKGHELIYKAIEENLKSLDIDLNHRNGLS